MKLFNKLLMAVSVVAMVAGCSTQGLEPHEELLARSVVVSGVSKYVQGGDDPAARAESTVEVIDKVLAFADDGEAFTLDELEAEARRQIPWDEMASEDALLADALVQYIRVELERRLEDADLPLNPDELVEMREVFQWAREAAEVYVERG